MAVWEILHRRNAAGQLKIWPLQAFNRGYVHHGRLGNYDATIQDYRMYVLFADPITKTQRPVICTIVHLLGILML